jgi:ceramide glucosyltransferase
MISIAPLLHTLCEVWAGLNLGFTATLLLGLWGLWRQRRRPSATQTKDGGDADRGWPSLVILRPCEGAEPGLFENLRSSITAAYPGSRRVLILVPSADDPAHVIAQELVRSLAAEGHPQAGQVTVRLTHPPPLCNRKVFQLSQAEALLPTDVDIVVCADSDVRLGDADLPALIAPLRPSATAASDEISMAASFAAPIEVAPQTAWDRIGAALVCASPQSFLALYGLYALRAPAASSRSSQAPSSRAPSPMMAGALCALRRPALSAIGGFAAFIDCLGEDNEIARRLCQAGYGIALSPLPARCYDGGRRRHEVIARAARWQAVVRAQRPLLWPSYPLMLGATPALLLLAVLWPSPVLCAFVTLLVLLRTLLAATLLRLQGLPAGALRALGSVFAGEVLLWLGFLSSLRSRHIIWRGHRFRIERGGRLRPVEKTA